jgi:hypothetical protein
MPALQEQMARAKLLHQEDLAAGYGAVYLPGALERKYPGAAREWCWQYVFPARDRSRDPRSGVIRRHHLDEGTVNKAIKAAVARVGIAKRVSSHTFRHYADLRIMPTRTGLTVRACLSAWSVGRWGFTRTRHNLAEPHRLLRKASSGSSGLKSRQAPPAWVVLAKACSLSARSASR